MARDAESFSQTFQAVKDYVKMHRRSVWLVPRESDYAISIIEPQPSELPEGTAAVLYDTRLEVVRTVDAAQVPFGQKRTPAR